MAPRRVLVLGGTGFLGSHVVRAFLAAGDEVVAAARAGSSRALLDDLAIEVLAADLQDPDALLAACRGRDLVVHAAGLLSLWERDKEQLYAVNVRGTRNVVEACLRAGVGRLLYDGSVGALAGTPSPVPVDERGADDATRLHSFHTVSMCLAEAEVLRGVARGLDAVILHPTLCFGESDRSQHSSWVLIGLTQARLAVCPPGGLNAVDIQDVARAHVAAAERGRRGAAYLLGGENLTNQAFLDLLQEVLARRGVTVHLSRGGARALGAAVETLARLQGADHGGWVTFNRALSQAMSLYWFVDDRRAREELGYVTGPVRPAIERQVAWLRAQGHLGDGFDPLGFARRFLGGR